VNRIHYNKTDDLYTYPVYGFNIPLRNEKDELINRNNVDSFLLKINENNCLYNFNQMTGNSILLNNEDAELVNLYAGITCSLRMKSASGANFYINELEQKYQDAYKYTDLLFLEGLKWQIFSKPDSAKLYFTKFLNFSGSKYSLRFRGYYFSDSAGVQFTNEREYARSFIKSEKQDPSVFFKQDISPRYYYESFSQGFVLNREDFGNRNIIPGIAIGVGAKGSYLYGIGAKWLARQNIIVSSQFSITNNYIGALANVPLQVYKSSDNSFGFKLTPLVYYQFVKKTKTAENVNISYINPGAGFSAGYHFNQRIYIGASYLLYLYSQFNKLYFQKKMVEIYQQNELDIGLYYQLIKGISVKAGIVNGSPVFGLTFTGNNMVYKFKTRSFELKPKIY
jgi:hypothetical protein